MTKEDARLILYKCMIFGDLTDKSIDSMINQCINIINSKTEVKYENI